MLTRLALAVTLLSYARPALAAETFQAVAVTAGSEDDARARVTELIDIKLFAKVIGFAAELPKVMEPDSLAGAPKGKWVVLLSICSSKKGEAKKLAAAIKDRAKDVSTFTVKGAHPDQCLPKRALEKVTDEESKLIQGVLKEPKRAKPRSAYATFLQSKNRLEEAEAQLKKAVEVEPDDYEAKNLLGVVQVLRQP
jgi:hypothetical protein